MTQNYDELLKRLGNESRYSQGNCLKCEKGFENHEYHCWGPETEGCMASQKELQITVVQWKKERKLAADAIRTLQTERDTAHNQAIEDAANWHTKEIDELSRLLETGTANRDGEIQMVMERQFHENSIPAIHQLKRPTA